jgi:ribosomal protein S18 acetylase RimI-like enzyme
MTDLGQRHVRSAILSDRTAVNQMLARAFQDDPVMAFIFPNPDVRRAKLPRFFSVIYDGDGVSGARLVTDGCEAATLWRRPGCGHLTLTEKIVQSLPWLRAAGFALGRALTISAASDANHPAEPHWYLHIAGCSPDHQGQGYGTAAIRAGLARADADGLPSYLETAKETNIGFYQGLGFHVTHSWRVHLGPQNWSMLRPAASTV